MRKSIKLLLFSTVFLVAAFASFACHTKAKKDVEFSKVVFVCEHGTVKSVIASEWFNRISAEKQIPMRSISLGVSPDEKIPDEIYKNLNADGFDLSKFKPKRFAAAELSDAILVVSIGIDEKKLNHAKNLPVINWSDIPPASTNYSASRDAIREHINVLVEQLSKR